MRKRLAERRRAPVRYSERRVVKILDAISAGSTIKEACRSVGISDDKTLWRWAKAMPHVQDALDEARRLGSQAVADDLMARSTEMADRGRAGKLNAGETSALKAHSEVVRWYVSKNDPSRYGERPHPVVQIQINSSLNFDDPNETTDTREHGYTITAPVIDAD